MITIMNACNWWIALCCLDLDFKKIEDQKYSCVKQFNHNC